MDRRTAALGGYYFFYFAAQACMASYLNVYLEQRMGLSGGELGLFNGLTALAPAVALPLFGWWADRTGRGGWLLTGALALLLICGEAMGSQVSLLKVILWGMGWEIARSACVALADQGTVALRNRRYGGFRALGSLGYLAGGMAMGFLTRRWELVRLLFPFYLGLLFPALLFSWGFHGTRRSDRAPVRLGDAVKLFHISLFRMSALLGVLGAVAVSALQPYVGSHLVTGMGAQPAILSWNTFCCVVPELLLLPLFSGKLVPQWGFRRCFLVIGLGLGLRCLIYALAPSPEFFLLGSLLYGLSVCGYTAVNLAFLRHVAPENLYATAVTVVAALSAVGRAVFGWLFGLLYQRWGSGSIFWLLMALALAVSFLLWQWKGWDELKEPAPAQPDSGHCR